MGFNLGLMGEAYKGAKAAEKYERDETFLEAQRANARAVMDANKPNLGLEADARGAELGLRRDTATANQGLLPRQTELKGAQLDNQITDATFEAGQKPVTQATQAANNQAGLTVAKGAEATAGDKVAQAKFAIAQAKQGNLQAFQEHLAHLLHQPDFSKDEVLNFVKEAAGSGALPNITADMVGDIRMGKSPDGTQNALYFTDATGKPTLPPITESRLSDIYTKAIARGVKPTTLADGAMAIVPDGKGGFRKVAENPKDPLSRLGDKTPAVVATATWLKQTGVAKTDKEAFDMAKALGSKTREQAAIEYITKTEGLTNKTIAEREKEFNDFWNRVHAAQPGNPAPEPGLTPPSNTPAPTTLDPKISAAIGL